MTAVQGKEFIMNRVYKVIWNRVKHCYVVVSEIAKNQGKDGKKSGSILRGAVLAALLAGAFTMPAFGLAGDVWAAATVETATQSQYIAFGDSNSGHGLLGKTPKADRTIDGYTYKNIKVDGSWYWVRNGYTIANAPQKFTTKSSTDLVLRPTKEWDGADAGILTTGQVATSASDIHTFSGGTLNDINVGTFGAVSNSEGTATDPGWNYIIQDNDGSWQDVSKNDRNHQTRFVTEGLTGDAESGYLYNGQAVATENVYSLANGGNKKTGVFVQTNGKVYTGTVYGIHNEVLMTGKDKDGNTYTYWASDLKDDQATVTQGTLNKTLDKIQGNMDLLHQDDIKRISFDKGGRTATVGLIRGSDQAVEGAVTVTAGGGNTEEGDTYIKLSTTADKEGIKFNTGSKVTGNSESALTKLTINGVDYTIQDKNDNDYVTSGTVSTKNGKTVLSLTRESGAVVPDIDLSEIKGTTYSADNGITISQDNKISAKVIENGNLTVDANGLALKKDIDLTNSGSLKVGGTTISKDTFDAGSKKITNVSAGVNDKDAVNVSQLNKATWTPKASGTAVTPLANGGKNYVNFKGSDHLTVTNTGAGEITFKDKDLAYTNLSNVTNITGTGKNAITNIAKDAIKVVAGTNVTVDTKAGDANTPKTFTITAKDTTLSPNGVKKDTIANGYKYTVSDTANHTAVIDDVASAKKLGEINTTLTGKLIKSGTIGTNGKITLQPNSGAAITLGGQLHDYVVSKGAIDTNGVITLNTIDKYSQAAGTPIKIDGIASRTWVNSVEDYVTKGQVNKNGTITLNRKQGGEVTIGGLESYVTGKDTYVTEATYNNVTKKLTIKQNQGRKAIEVNLADITSGLSKTDYRLVQNPSAADGKYTVNSSGEVALKIKDEASGKIETVTVGGIAVVYDADKNLKSTNSKGTWNEISRWSQTQDKTTSITLGKDTWVSVQGGLLSKADSILFGNTKHTGGIAIGENVKSLNNSVVLGINAYTGKLGNVTLKEYNSVDSLGVGATSVGSNSFTSGTLATNVGAFNISTTDYINDGGANKKGYAFQNFGAVNIGTLNSIESYGSHSDYAGIANSVIGMANKTQNTNGSLVFGTANEITNSNQDISYPSSYKDAAAAANSFRESVQNGKAGGAVLAIGGGNKADNTHYSQMLGVQNMVNGSTLTMVNGYKNTVTDSENVSIIGTQNTVKGNSNVLMGDNHTVTGANNILIGSTDTATDTQANNAVILGHNANATVDGGVALGEGSQASTKAGKVGYLGVADTTDSTWKSTAAAVSVGGNGVTRQITNVAAGSADTDAVNVAQLKKVADVANAGWNISTDKPDGSSQTRNVAAGSTLKVTSSDSNLLADLSEADNGTVVMKVDLNKDITLKADDDMSQFVSISGSKGTIWTSGNITVGTDPDKSIALHADTQTITGLSNTTWDGTTNNVSRAATEGQLQSVAETASKGWNLSTNGGTAQKVAPGDTVDFSNTDKNVVISSDGTKVMVNLAENLTASSLTTGSAIMNGTGFGIIGKKGQPVYYITEDGLNANGQKITNVMAGTEDTDAVNVSQLEDVKSLASKHSTVTVNDKDKAVNKNLVLEESTNDNGGTNYDVKLADKVTLGTGTKQVILDGTEGRGTFGNVIVGTQDVGGINGFYVTGLTNTTFHISNGGYKDYAGSGRAATEGQLYDAFSFLDNKIDNISITGDGNVVVNPDGKGNGGTGEGGTTTPGTGPETSDPKPSPNWNIGLNNEKITLGDATNSVVIEGTKGNIATTGTVSAGDTSISSDGLKVGDKTYVSKDGLNANDQKVTNVAAGDVSATSKDAVNGSQLYGVEQKVDNNSQNINILNGSLRNLDNRVNRVGAGAAALAALHPLDFDPDAKWDFSAGYGNYNGANAVSVGAFYRPNEDLMFSVGGSMGGGENMVNAGLSVKLGSGSSHVTTSKVAMAKEIKDLRQTVDAQAQQIAELAAMVRELTGKGTQTPTAGMFPDVPENHWAYEAVKDLKDRGYVAGYPDGTFKGDRTMTRYEFAQIVHNALQAGAPDSEAVKKLKAEFAPELERFTVDTIEQDKNGNPTIQRVRVVKKANG